VSTLNELGAKSSSTSLTATGHDDSMFIKLLDKQQQPLYLNMEIRYTSEGILKMVVYAKYWIINTTALKLYYRPTADFAKSKLAAGQSK
jgi:hypothetical protein